MAGAGKKGLTKATIKKYKMVVDEWFINDFNGTQAYKKYYPRVKDETATVNFSKLKEQPEIKEYIKAKQDKISKTVEATHASILSELLRWATSDITQTIAISKEEIKDLPPEVRRLINKYKINRYENYDKDGALLGVTENIELSFVSKERAMEMINKHIGFYEVDNRQKAATVNITTTNEKHKSLVEDILNGEK